MGGVVFKKNAPKSKMESCVERSGANPTQLRLEVLGYNTYKLTIFVALDYKTFLTPQSQKSCFFGCGPRKPKLWGCLVNCSFYFAFGKEY